MKGVLLTALGPQPLASYLGALGALRIASRSVGGGVRGSFAPTGFRLEEIGAADIHDLFMEQYAPTPVLTPWNNASGFYSSSKGMLAADAIDSIVKSRDPRFAAYSAAIGAVRAHITARGLTDAPEDEDKARFIATLRSELPDEAIEWIDATAVIDGDDARMMPLLGSGGNEGVLDYSGLFLRSLVIALLEDRERSRRLLDAALFGTVVTGLERSPAGQFSPGAAGGFNTGPGFEHKKLPNNPWSFILLIEGSVLWASAIAARQAGLNQGYRFAVSPFTVRHRAVGHSSASRPDDDPQAVRAEIWMPVWRRPTTLGEIERFVAEGRMDVRGSRGTSRRASDSVAVAEAIASLGTDRGVDAFIRYTLIKRRGDSYVALPTGRIEVTYRSEVELLQELDSQLPVLDGFLGSFRGDGPPAQLAERRRVIDQARFDVAARGGEDAIVSLVRAIGSLEMFLARRDPGKDPSLSRPLGGLSARWIEACGNAPEVRLAAAVASLSEGAGALPFRAYVAPLDPRDTRRYAPAARALGYTGMDVWDRLANVLLRRLLDANRSATAAARSDTARESGSPEDGEAERDRASSEPARRAPSRRDETPFWGAVRAGPKHISLLLEGELSSTSFEELLFGFTWVRHTSAEEPAARALDLDHHAPPLPRDYALLSLLFRDKQEVGRGAGRRLLPTAKPALVSLLRAGRVDEALRVGAQQLRGRGFAPRRVEPARTDPGYARRLAAALLVPAHLPGLLRDALLPEASPDDDDPKGDKA